MNVSGILLKRHVRGLCKRWMSQLGSKPETSFSAKLWNETENIRDSVLNTTFVTDIKTGILDPTAFADFKVQSAKYCQKANQILLKASKKTCDEDLKTFLFLRALRYQGYYKPLFNDTSGVELGQALQSYVDVLDYTTHLNPLYVVVACLPCVRLWPWIGLKLKDEETNINYGCYTDWAKEYFNPDSTSHKKYEIRVDEAFKNGDLDEKAALGIYTKCMEAEVGFFDSIKADPKLNIKVYTCLKD